MTTETFTTKIVLVYQAGIANVFRVESLNLRDFGRDAVRLYQGDFVGARMFCAGAAAMGATIRTAACNQAGDIARAQWTPDLESQPFADKLVDVCLN